MLLETSYCPQPGSEDDTNLGASSSTLPALFNDRFRHDHTAAPRKRHIDRACDACRRKKTKCDGSKMRENVCTNCLQTHKHCTYLEASIPRGPTKAYITGLEDKLAQFEELLKQLRPDTDFSHELGPPVIRGSWKTDESQSKLRDTKSPTRRRNSSLSSVSARHPSAEVSPLSSDTPTLNLSTHLIFKPQSPSRRSKREARSSPTSVAMDNESSSDYFTSSDTDELVDSFDSGMQKLTLRGNGVNSIDGGNFTRFHGKSSNMRLIDATRKFRERHMQKTLSEPGDSDTATSSSGSSGLPESGRRSEFWQPPQWELRYEGLYIPSASLIVSAVAQFPPTALAENLIELYFLHTNTQFPLLHRPTFNRHWRERLYNRNIWFACVCLSIFAVASRWSNDIRVLPESELEKKPDEIDWTLAGQQLNDAAINIHRVRRSLIYPACLFEVQTFTLIAMYLRGTVNNPVGWTFVSIGIRKAQDVGAHRKKVYSRTPTVDDELWKRAFWCLVAFDRIGSASLGRPCVIGEEDFDLDLPLQVDDEFWETGDPVSAFKQPPGIPAQVCAFNMWLKLTQIIAFALRTIYSIGNPRAPLGRFTKGRTEEIVDQLNVALTEWIGAVPDHLKWSSQMDNAVVANQAATLFTTYYLTEMLIYRPFIPPPVASPSEARGASESVSFPYRALSICTNAAKSCARIVEEQIQRGYSNIPNLISVAPISAAILLVSVLDLKAKAQVQRERGAEDVKPPIAHTIETLMADVSIFIRALEWALPRWAQVPSLLQGLKDILPGSDSVSVGKRPDTQTPCGPELQARSVSVEISSTAWNQIQQEPPDLHSSWQPPPVGLSNEQYRGPYRANPDPSAIPKNNGIAETNPLTHDDHGSRPKWSPPAFLPPPPSIRSSALHQSRNTVLPSVSRRVSVQAPSAIQHEPCLHQDHCSGTPAGPGFQYFYIQDCVSSTSEVRSNLAEPHIVLDKRSHRVADWEYPQSPGAPVHYETMGPDQDLRYLRYD